MRVFPIRRPPHLGPFAVLLCTLLATLVGAPFLEERLFGLSRFRLFATAILFAGVYAVSRRRPSLAAGLATGLPALLVEGWVHVRPAPHLVVASFALSFLFLLSVGTAIFYAILDEERVSLDTILGGVCVYLLLGVAWTLVYSILEYLAPGTFLVDGQPLATPTRPDEFRREELMYFSFVTLTTVGYGDVLARSQPARALAAAEAVTGSLYLAVFIARLVGLHMVHQRRDLDL
jgi:hypothetical protein